MAFSSAYNLNRDSSLGSALWVGFFWTDLIDCYGRKQLIQWFHGAEPNAVSFVEVLAQWIADGVPLWYLVQTPGSLVYSPPSIRGAGHLVLSLGPNLMQTAWNASITLEAFTACVHHFRDWPFTRHNGGEATRWQIPCLRLQSRGFLIGLAEDVRTARAVCDAIRTQRPELKIVDLSTNEYCATKEICKKCNKLLDLFSCSGSCLECAINRKRPPAAAADEFPFGDSSARTYKNRTTKKPRIDSSSAAASAAAPLSSK